MRKSFVSMRGFSDIAQRRSADQHDLGAITADMAEILARSFEALLPELSEFVDAGVGEGISYCPEASDEGVSLVALSELGEGLPFFRGDQQVDLVQPSPMARRRLADGTFSIGVQRESDENKEKGREQRSRDSSREVSWPPLRAGPL